MSDRAVWKSKTGFLLAALGSAVGLGNIWRFPYMVYRNGGGTFFIPYLVALFIVGIPLLIVEFGLGHYTRRAFPQALGRIHPRLSWIGWWAISFVMFGIVVYYAAVIAWCGNYIVYSVTQPWMTSEHVSSFFSVDFLGHGEKGFQFCTETRDASNQVTDVAFHFGRTNWSVLISLAVVWFINWFITQRKLQNGIELANKILMPLLFVLISILVIWSWGFKGAAAGRTLYLTPDWNQVLRPQTWIDAFTQIFFTLSIGLGVMVAYASYLPEKADIPGSAFIAAMGNCLFSVFAAFAVFAAIGMLADKQNIDLNRMAAIDREMIELTELQQSNPTAFVAQKEHYKSLQAEQARNQKFQKQTQTFGLLFQTYPVIITEMGPFTGRLFGVLFFVSLVVAGISSSISIVEGFQAALADQFGWSRRKVSTILCLIGFLLGIVFCMQSALMWLDLVDHFITTYGLVLVALGEAIAVGWLFPARRLRQHLDASRDFRFGKQIGFAMRILITLVLALTWFGLVQMRDADTVAVALGRFAILASVLILWINQHWLDFNIRLLIPALLIFLLDQSLLKEMKAHYGGYPLAAILGIGVTWFVGTLLIGIILSWLPGKNPLEPPLAHSNDE